MFIFFKKLNNVFNDAIEELVKLATRTHVNEVKEQHKDTLQVLFINCLLGYAYRQCIAIPQNIERSKYKELAKANNIDNRRLKRCLHALAGGEDLIDDPDSGMIYRVQKGYLNNITGINKASTYFPTTKFISTFEDALYCDFGGWDNLTDDRLIGFNDSNENEIPKAVEISLQLSILRKYNEFMRHQRWALKNPSTMTYSKVYPRGGRVNNFYQNIVNRKIPLRISSTINGNAIAEPDLQQITYGCLAI